MKLIGSFFEVQLDSKDLEELISKYEGGRVNLLLLRKEVNKVGRPPLSASHWVHIYTSVDGSTFTDVSAKNNPIFVTIQGNINIEEGK